MAEVLTQEKPARQETFFFVNNGLRSPYSPDEVSDKLRFNISLFPESDGSVTGVVDELDLVENAETQKDCLALLISAMRDYARDFYQEFELWASAPNRRTHIPYVLKILSSSDAQLTEDIVCRVGRI